MELKNNTIFFFAILLGLSQIDRSAWGSEGVSFEHPVAAIGSAGFESSGVKNAALATVAITKLSPGENVPSNRPPAPMDIKGTGFHIGDGYIKTALHVVSESGEHDVPPPAIVILTRRGHVLSANAAGFNGAADLAVYRVSENNVGLLPGIAKFSAEEAQPGEPAFTVGFPGGWLSTTFGHISSTDFFLPTAAVTLFQINISVCGGNSGGGLFNSKGEVVGMIQSMISTESGQGFLCSSALSFAVPAALLKKAVLAIRDGGLTRFSRIGLEMESAMVGNQWRVAAAKVFEPAFSAGVRSGDIILSIDGIEIEDASQLRSYLLTKTSPGHFVTLRVLRDGQIISFNFQLD